jgi:hypothetical protein
MPILILESKINYRIYIYFALQNFSWARTESRAAQPGARQPSGRSARSSQPSEHRARGPGGPQAATGQSEAEGMLQERAGLGPRAGGGEKLLRDLNV